MANIRQTALLDLIPSNLRSDPQVVAAAEALNVELQAVTTAIDETLLLARLDDLPESVVDILAWQWHVDFYEPTLALEKKRALLRQSIAWHKRKGTPSAVQEMVSSVFAGGKVYEWWEYGGEPYHFRVEATDNIQEGSMYDRLAHLIEVVKNTRSWLDSIRVLKEKPSSMVFGSARCIAIRTRLLPAKIFDSVVNGSIRPGTVHHTAIRITIKAEVS